MNAQSVWPGHEYAYTPYVRKKYFPTDARRVKVISVRKVSAWGKQRDDTMATIEFNSAPGVHREVNVRNLYDFWDSYEDEKNGRLAEAERKEQERIRQEEERKVEQIRQRKRAEKIKTELAYKLSIDPHVVQLSYYGDSVTIRLQDLQFLVPED